MAPLWQQVRDDVERRIVAGEFDRGFPGEHALGAHYEVSRHTVRAALRSLREAGVISAARGQQPRVLRTKIEQPLGTLYSLFASVEAAGGHQSSIVRTLDERHDAHAAATLGLPEEAPLIFLHRLRLVDGEPIALDRVWLPADRARPLLDVDFGHTGLYVELERRCGVRATVGTETVDAVVLNAAQARVLDTDCGAAAFEISRRTIADDVAVEWRTTLVRADRFRIVGTFAGTAGVHLAMADSHPTRR